MNFEQLSALAAEVDELKQMLLAIIKECEDYTIPSAKKISYYDMIVEVDDLQVLIDKAKSLLKINE